MKPKATIKIIIDILMTAALLFLMGYQLWGDTAHEIVGAGLFLLFIVHHILNRNFYKNLFRGKYTPMGILQFVIDGLVLAVMIMLMVSGITMSRHVFAFLPIHGGMAMARRLHILGSYWGFILMSMHLGLHWNQILGMLRKTAGVKKHPNSERFFALLLGFLFRDTAAGCLLKEIFRPTCSSKPSLYFWITASLRFCFILIIWRLCGFASLSPIISQSYAGKSKIERW